MNIESYDAEIEFNSMKDIFKTFWNDGFKKFIKCEENTARNVVKFFANSEDFVFIKPAFKDCPEMYIKFDPDEDAVFLKYLNKREFDKEKKKYLFKKCGYVEHIELIKCEDFLTYIHSIYSAKKRNGDFSLEFENKLKTLLK